MARKLKHGLVYDLEGSARIASVGTHGKFAAGADTAPLYVRFRGPENDKFEVVDVTVHLSFEETQELIESLVRVMARYVADHTPGTHLEVTL